MLTDKPQRELGLGERTTKCRAMRHDCKKDGCFENRFRCHLGKLDHLFPGNECMSDLDGYCHLDGRFLFIEWKSTGASLEKKTERNLLELSLTDNHTVIAAWGDATTMLPEEWWYAESGRWTVVKDNPAEEFDLFLRRWANKVKEAAA